MLTKCKLAFCSPNKEKKFNVFILNQLIGTFPSASNSVVLSAAAYIVKNFPDLPHPYFLKSKTPHDRKDIEYPSLYLSVHPLFDEWVELLAEAFFNQNAFRVDDTMYLKVEVNEDFGELLKLEKWSYDNSEHNPTVIEIFGIKEKLSEKRIGWINCSTSQINKKLYEPNVNSVAVLLGQIYNNEQYFLHNILRGQIPSVQQLISYDAIIIPGSGLSVISNVPKISQLSKNIEIAYKKSDRLKILGICYGHQLIAQIFGATVIKRQRYGGLQSIRFSKQIIQKFSFLQPLSKLQNLSLQLSEHHEDFVTTIPAGFLQLAVSNSCENEAFVSENGRIFTSQYHPQYCYPYTKGYTSRIKVYHSGKVQDKVKYAHNRQVIEKHMKNTQLMRECIRRFI